jgi:hypothetical protein
MTLEKAHLRCTGHTKVWCVSIYSFQHVRERLYPGLEHYRSWKMTVTARIFCLPRSPIFNESNISSSSKGSQAVAAAAVFTLRF